MGKVWPWDLTRVVTTHLARGSLRIMRSMASPTVAAPVQSCSRRAWGQEKGPAQQAACHHFQGQNACMGMLEVCSMVSEEPSSCAAISCVRKAAS